MQAPRTCMMHDVRPIAMSVYPQKRIFSALSDMSASLIGRFGSSAFKAIQPIPCRCRLRARASLRTRRKVPSSMGFENEGNNLWVGLTVKGRQVQADMRSHLIHRPARDIIPPRGGARVFSYRL